MGPSAEKRSLGAPHVKVPMQPVCQLLDTVNIVMQQLGLQPAWAGRLHGAFCASSMAQASPAIHATLAHPNAVPDAAKQHPATLQDHPLAISTQACGQDSSMHGIPPPQDARPAQSVNNPPSSVLPRGSHPAGQAAVDPPGLPSTHNPTANIYIVAAICQRQDLLHAFRHPGRPVCHSPTCDLILTTALPAHSALSKEPPLPAATTMTPPLNATQPTDTTAHPQPPNITASAPSASAGPSTAGIPSSHPPPHQTWYHGWALGLLTFLLGILTSWGIPRTIRKRQWLLLQAAQRVPTSGHHRLPAWLHPATLQAQEAQVPTDTTGQPQPVAIPAASLVSCQQPADTQRTLLQAPVKPRPGYPFQTGWVQQNGPRFVSTGSSHVPPMSHNPLPEIRPAPATAVPEELDIASSNYEDPDPQGLHSAGASHNPSLASVDAPRTSSFTFPVNLHPTPRTHTSPPAHAAAVVSRQGLAPQSPGSQGSVSEWLLTGALHGSGARPAATSIPAVLPARSKGAAAGGWDLTAAAAEGAAESTSGTGGGAVPGDPLSFSPLPLQHSLPHYEALTPIASAAGLLLDSSGAALMVPDHSSSTETTPGTQRSAPVLLLGADGPLQTPLPQTATPATGGSSRSSTQAAGSASGHSTDSSELKSIYKTLAHLFSTGNSHRVLHSTDDHPPNAALHHTTPVAQPVSEAAVAHALQTLASNGQRQSASSLPHTLPLVTTDVAHVASSAGPSRRGSMPGSLVLTAQLYLPLGLPGLQSPRTRCGSPGPASPRVHRDGHDADSEGSGGGSSNGASKSHNRSRAGSSDGRSSTRHARSMHGGAGSSSGHSRATVPSTGGEGAALCLQDMPTDSDVPALTHPAPSRRPDTALLVSSGSVTQPLRNPATSAAGAPLPAHNDLAPRASVGSSDDSHSSRAGANRASPYAVHAGSIVAAAGALKASPGTPATTPDSVTPSASPATGTPATGRAGTSCGSFNVRSAGSESGYLPTELDAHLATLQSLIDRLVAVFRGGRQQLVEVMALQRSLLPNTKEELLALHEEPVAALELIANSVGKAVHEMQSMVETLAESEMEEVSKVLQEVDACMVSARRLATPSPRRHHRSAAPSPPNSYNRMPMPVPVPPATLGSSTSGSPAAGETPVPSRAAGSGISGDSTAGQERRGSRDDTAVRSLAEELACFQGWQAPSSLGATTSPRVPQASKPHIASGSANKTGPVKSLGGASVGSSTRGFTRSNTYSLAEQLQHFDGWKRSDLVRSSSAGTTVAAAMLPSAEDAATLADSTAPTGGVTLLGPTDIPQGSTTSKSGVLVKRPARDSARCISQGSGKPEKGTPLLSRPPKKSGDDQGTNAAKQASSTGASTPLCGPPQPIAPGWPWTPQIGSEGNESLCLAGSEGTDSVGRALSTGSDGLMCIDWSGDIAAQLGLVEPVEPLAPVTGDQAQVTAPPGHPTPGSTTRPAMRTAVLQTATDPGPLAAQQTPAVGPFEATLGPRRGLGGAGSVLPLATAAEQLPAGSQETLLIAEGAETLPGAYSSALLRAEGAGPGGDRVGSDDPTPQATVASDGGGGDRVETPTPPSEPAEDTARVVSAAVAAAVQAVVAASEQEGVLAGTGAATARTVQRNSVPVAATVVGTTVAETDVEAQACEHDMDEPEVEVEGCEKTAAGVPETETEAVDDALDKDKDRNQSEVPPASDETDKVGGQLAEGGATRELTTRAGGLAHHSRSGSAPASTTQGNSSGSGSTLYFTPGSSIGAVATDPEEWMLVGVQQSPRTAGGGDAQKGCRDADGPGSVGSVDESVRIKVLSSRQAPFAHPVLQPGDDRVDDTV